MTKLVGQDGTGWTQVASADFASNGEALYYGGVYTAIAGQMQTVHVKVGATGGALKATVYVFSGTGAGATFVAMSAELSVNATGDQTAAIAGNLSAGPYTLVLQPATSAFSTTINSGSSNFVAKQNTVAHFPYRAAPGTIPAADVSTGHEFIVWIDGALPTVAAPAGAAGSPPGPVGKPELGKGMGPYKRPGQVFGDPDPVSPRLSSRAPPPAPRVTARVARLVSLSDPRVPLVKADGVTDDTAALLALLVASGVL